MWIVMGASERELAAVRAAWSAVDGAEQLRLAHLRAALDALLTGLVVQLVERPATRATVRTQTTPARRRDVLDRGATGLSRLAGPGPLLVDRPGGDLLGLALGGAPIAEAVLDVLVLSLAFRGPGGLRHSVHLRPLMSCWGGRDRVGGAGKMAPHPTLSRVAARFRIPRASAG